MYDAVIIGGGIVGTATAMALQENGIRNVIVLEAESKLAAHQTGNNSGVIHSGLYYKPGSLKAKNCVEGREQMYKFCELHGIKHELCGKLVVALNQEEIAQLQKLEERGKANGLVGIKKLSKEELKEYEPHVNGLEGLFIPQTGIVDYNQVTEAYAKIILANGGEVKINSKFLGLSKENNLLILETNSAEYKTRFLVNCAGLHSDQVAKICGVNPGLQIIPFRGEYYKLKKEKEHLVKNLIYPVPDIRFPFLGVHFTRMIKGGVEAGPNAVLAFKREGYSHKEFSPTDIIEMAVYPGFWKMAAKYYKMGIGEFHRSLNKSAFVKALQKLIPEIQLDDLTKGGAGVRAQAVDPNGNLVDDFRIVEAEKMIHVLNAPSPAATASISIGRTIAEKVKENF
ncbi:MAG: L-2-hydroxyglutarate oxidase [Ignavibacteriaceae bacterium]|nr:L-2-hydroxyglutarate oxidase [Ignavibacteriaceae bacterium]